MILFLFAALAFAAPKDEGCRALCVRDGFDGGQGLKRGCVCFSIKDDYEDFLRARIRLGVVDRNFKVKLQLRNEAEDGESAYE